MLGQHQYRVRVIGTYEGNPFTYEDPPECKGSSFVHNRGDLIDPSSFWWSGGNMSCDCNRDSFVGKSLECGDDVKVERVEPIDENWPTLILNESDPGSSGHHGISSLVMLGIGEEYVCGITDEHRGDEIFMDVKHEDDMKTAYVTVITNPGVVHQCRVIEWLADDTEGILFVRGNWSIA